jgi:hypothetical protein
MDGVKSKHGSGDAGATVAKSMSGGALPQRLLAASEETKPNSQPESRWENLARARFTWWLTGKIACSSIKI